LRHQDAAPQQERAHADGFGRLDLSFRHGQNGAAENFGCEGAVHEADREDAGRKRRQFDILVIAELLRDCLKKGRSPEKDEQQQD
jgi:hypothetical protein